MRVCACENANDVNVVNTGLLLWLDRDLGYALLMLVLSFIVAEYTSFLYLLRWAESVKKKM
jgi:hypothetical protein